jgi:hypothetical protein
MQVVIWRSLNKELYHIARILIVSCNKILDNDIGIAFYKYNLSTALRLCLGACTAFYGKVIV